MYVCTYVCVYAVEPTCLTQATPMMHTGEYMCTCIYNHECYSLNVCDKESEHHSTMCVTKPNTSFLGPVITGSQLAVSLQGHAPVQYPWPLESWDLNPQAHKTLETSTNTNTTSNFAAILFKNHVRRVHDVIIA